MPPHLPLPRPELVGQRVVAEINCRVAPFENPDPIMVRNHAAGVRSSNPLPSTALWFVMYLQDIPTNPHQSTTASPHPTPHPLDPPSLGRSPRTLLPGRTVLGIIAKDGCMAQYVVLPAENLYRVPDEVSDREAAFAEPLAAACRILEQQVGGRTPIPYFLLKQVVCKTTIVGILHPHTPNPPP